MEKKNSLMLKKTFEKEIGWLTKANVVRWYSKKQKKVFM